MLSRRSLSVVAALAVVATACQQDLPSTPTASGPSFAVSSNGVDENISTPFSFATVVPCANGGAGEIISMDGNLHELINVTSDGDGGFHLKVHDQPQGLAGVGLITGDKYEGTGVTQFEENVTPGTTYSYVNNFRMIGQGPGNNYLEHINMHVTINVNGDLTVSAGNSSVECK